MVTTLKKTNKKGFTLVELVIVIAILAILAAIAVPTVSNVIGQANTSVDAANAQTVELALKSADAEITGGTWTGTITGETTTYTHASLPVSVALKHNGIMTLPTARVNGAVYRSRNGKISLSTLTSDGVAFSDTSTPLALVADVLANTEAGK